MATVMACKFKDSVPSSTAHKINSHYMFLTRSPAFLAAVAK